MTKKERNDAIYKHLKASREKDPKHYGLNCLAVSYEDVRNYAKSEGCDREELKYLAQRLTMRIREVAENFGLSSAEIKAFFAQKNYSLSF